MALYRCGGGGSASTLITKSVTQNGTYDAIDDNADGYSSVTVNVSGGCTIMDKATWDTKTFAQKKAQGLTVIKNSAEVTGEWFDYSNITLPFAIRAELYQNTEGNITLPAMDNAIFFTGAWANSSGNYDDLKLTLSSSITYDSKIGGSVTPYYYATPIDKMVTILKNTSACSMNYRNGYNPNGYYSYGAVISIDDANATLSVLGDFNDTQTHVITTTEAYDGIICITSKGLQNSGCNGLIEINGTYDSRFDGNEKLISDLSKSCISIYSNVATGAEITISTPLGSRAGSAVIGVKLSNS